MAFNLFALFRRTTNKSPPPGAPTVGVGRATTHYQRANGLKNAGDWGAALASYDRAIEVDPGHANALCNRGVVLQRLGRLEEALASYDRAIAANPSDALAHYNRGVVLGALSRPDAALESYDRAIEANPNYAEAYCNRGVLLVELGRQEAALASYDRCIEINAGFSPAYFNRGALLTKRGQWDASLRNYDRAIALRPDYAEAFCNRGALLNDLGQWDAALASFEQAISLKPDLAEAHASRADALLNANRLHEAVASFDQAMALQPELNFLLGSSLHAKMSICAWPAFDSDVARLTAAVEAGAAASPPFYVLGLVDSPGLHRQSAEAWVRATCAADASLGNIPKRARPLKLRIGYFSADFRDHAVAHLLAGLIDHHDRSRFEILGLSYGPDTRDRYRQRLEGSFDRFIDVRTRSNVEIASLARELELDIGVDLAGHTRWSRTGVFALRVAPLQVNYLGYPGTLGAGYMDYVIADPTVLPPGAGDHYAEKIIHLPHSYQANDSRRAIADRVFSRTELGLPAQGFVFCCFNNTYKILPAVFARWMRILNDVPGSVLWLLGTDAAVVASLRRWAQAAGIEPDRLIFTTRMALPEHLARHRAADLFLDTLPYNAHTTASDALWAGLPLLTCSGESFASRVAASLLRAIDLPELIAPTPQRYEELAVELALDPPRLAAIRTTLGRHRLTKPLFDTRLYARHLEAAYASIYDRYQQDLPPDNIRVTTGDIPAQSADESVRAHE